MPYNRTLRLVSLIVPLFVFSEIVTGQIIITSPKTHQAQNKDQVVSNSELAKAELLSSHVVELYQAGKFDEALPEAKRVLKIRMIALNPKDLAIAHALDNLARVYLAKKKDDQAEPLLKRSVVIYERNAGKEEQTWSRDLDLLAQIHYHRWELPNAEELYLKAIALKERVFAPTDAQLLYSLESLAQVYKSARQYRQAELVMHRVVAIKTMVLGENHPAVGKDAQWLSCLMYKNSEQTEAALMEARANHILYSETVKRSEPVVLPPEIVGCRVADWAGFEITFKDTLDGGVTVPTIAIETDENGQVISARMITGSESVKDRALHAALKTKLRPTIVDGRAVPIKGEMSFQFSGLR